MKKRFAAILAILMLLTIVASALAEQPPRREGPVRKTGMLSLLNATEQEYAAYKGASQFLYDQLVREGLIDRGKLPAPEDGMTAPGDDGEPPVFGEGGAPEESEQPFGIVFFDSLDTMLMALEAGEINDMEIYRSAAEYLCTQNDKLNVIHPIDISPDCPDFVKTAVSLRLSSDFSFLMLEKNSALRDEFSAAIQAMKEDGTLERLVREQIQDLLEGKEIAPVQMPEFEGVDAIRVAVTGDLPPMDYVTANGTPAGFNTAVLAEISQRIGKPIQLLVISSPARSVALASGRVDVVFWVRANTLADSLAGKNEEERLAFLEEKKNGISEEMSRLVDMNNATAPLQLIGSYDIPAGTVITEAYYSDTLVHVELSKDQAGAAK